MFSLIRLSYNGEAELIYKVKSKDIFEYIEHLDSSSVLEFINKQNIPTEIVEKVVEQKYGELEEAIKNASVKEIETTFRKSKDTRIANLILENRVNTLYQIIRDLNSREILIWLNQSYLPVEFKDYLISCHKEELDECIEDLSISRISFTFLAKSSHLPDSVKEKIFEVHKSGYENKFLSLREDEVFNTIKYAGYDALLNKLLIELRINRYNIFELLSQYRLDESIIEMVFSSKEDVLKDIIKRKTLDDLTKLNDTNMP
jgi:hypothetical protein